MQTIKIGDRVVFYDTMDKLNKTGQVVDVQDDICAVYVEKEKKVYNLFVNQVKKIW